MTGVVALPSLHGTNWDDMNAVSTAAQAAFTQLLDDQWAELVTLLQALPDNAELVSMCETYDFLDKLVLHNDPEHGFRVRLHVFRPGYFDRPHNHRWSFASKILAGSYQHTQYGADDKFDDATLDSLHPLQIRTERAGDSYVLHHTAVHSVTAEGGTISLILRGPAAKDRFRILDATTQDSLYVVGAQNETAAQRAAKRMPAQRLARTVADVLAARPA